jgi:hypothetical protein
MKKVLFLLPALFLVSLILNAQTPQSLKKVMELQMPKTVDDDMPGTRGASVVWHPIQKKYYASFAGNIGYPMAVFDIKGKRLSSEDLATMMDTRGIWYNPVTKQVCGNGYSTAGWFSYTIDKTGIPTDAEFTFEGKFQPGDQSVGVYNPTAKQVLFLNLSQVFMYDKDAEPKDSVAIHWGRKKADGPADNEDLFKMHEDYNSTSVIYTGIKGQELGFLNITNQQIELYDIKTGYLTKVLSLPDTSVVESVFNFAYANGIYWLFNIEMRKWVGYK